MVPEKEVFALSPGGPEIGKTFAYFQAHTYLGVTHSTVRTTRKRALPLIM
jgi:hypothetical protein